MILMSDDLTDRIIIEHDEEQTSDPSTASVTFYHGADVIGSCPIRRMQFSADCISFTFACVPSLAVTLGTKADVRCILTAGQHMLDYDLRNPDVTWDSREGKQDCTIISKIDKIRSNQ